MIFPFSEVGGWKGGVCMPLDRSVDVPSDADKIKNSSTSSKEINNMKIRKINYSHQALSSQISPTTSNVAFHKHKALHKSTEIREIPTTWYHSIKAFSLLTPRIGSIWKVEEMFSHHNLLSQALFSLSFHLRLWLPQMDINLLGFHRISLPLPAARSLCGLLLPLSNKLRRKKFTTIYFAGQPWCGWKSKRDSSLHIDSERWTKLTFDELRRFVDKSLQSLVGIARALLSLPARFSYCLP